MDPQPTWSGCALGKVWPFTHPLNESLPDEFRPDTPTHLWSPDYRGSKSGYVSPSFANSYKEARRLADDGSAETLIQLRDVSSAFIKTLSKSMETSELCTNDSLVKLRLSDDLKRWKAEQHQLGRILPAKGTGLKRASDKVLEILGASEWPEPLVTRSALWGSVFFNMCIGACDAPTMFSNGVTDMAFFREHGYHHVFPEFDNLFWSSMHDQHALETPGGARRRTAVAIGVQYINDKIVFEEQNQANLEGLSARMDRQTMQTVSLFESSLLGLVGESTHRGFDAAAVMNDMVLSCPATDVVDVGSDLVNSEVMNSFLNTTDISETGIVTEEALKRVYNAYAHAGARTLAERWWEPTARMLALLYQWHIVNHRHNFLRRAVLGYCKVQHGPSDQREADMDESFDENLKTTGFSRPLKDACNGADKCDKVSHFLEHSKNPPMLGHLWQRLVFDPLEYVRKGEVDGSREAELEEALQLALAKTYTEGYALELCWIMAHAGHHAWQINRLYEAAMFGSLLDSEALAGKLDRAEA
ncbi:unnamed protein product [Clonostachys rosea]|uniref:Uncharacterized protein n=1 Tax=Bionectria ochroleuca TaxID=29856 RepID=A0ABY6U9R4_BIOOC|nr:unnamed protein product [Clonostachys rosea]